MKSTVPYTVAAILAGASLRALAASPADAPPAPANTGSTASTDTGASTTATDMTAQLTTIVVTAQRRSENIQDVPISISAFSGQMLTEANVLTVQDLGKVASNFQATKGVQSSFLRINIRGIGAAGNTTIEPSVAVFVDGIYVPRAGAIVGGLMDMESVEVLRGPQGTLFGRNASVGALSLHTATPKRDFAGEVTGEIGNADRYKLSGFVNVPVGDKVAVRLAGMSQWFGGYWTNALDGKQLGGVDEQALRGSLKADLGKFEWIVRADYSHSEGDGFTNLDFDATSVSADQLAALRQRSRFPPRFRSTR